jgi:phenylacetate-coenzyme A ligase PaaK-like adenylate-forming protein
LKTEVCKTDNAIEKFGTGSLIITPTQNLAMPLVRFNTEDIVTLEDKDGVRIIRTVIGRKINYFTTLKGNLVNPALDPSILFKTGIKQIQFIQETLNHIIVKYIPINTKIEIDKISLKNKLKILMEGNINIDFIKTDLITQPHKKHLTTISKVKTSII